MRQPTIRVVPPPPPPIPACYMTAPSLTSGPPGSFPPGTPLGLWPSYGGLPGPTPYPPRSVPHQRNRHTLSRQQPSSSRGPPRTSWWSRFRRPPPTGLAETIFDSDSGGDSENGSSSSFPSEPDQTARRGRYRRDPAFQRESGQQNQRVRSNRLTTPTEGQTTAISNNRSNERTITTGGGNNSQQDRAENGNNVRRRTRRRRNQASRHVAFEEDPTQSGRYRRHSNLDRPRRRSSTPEQAPASTARSPAELHNDEANFADHSELSDSSWAVSNGREGNMRLNSQRVRREESMEPLQPDPNVPRSPQNDHIHQPGLRLRTSQSCPP